MDPLTRPATVYESPYQLRPDDDLWRVYAELCEAHVGREFEVMLPSGEKVTMGELEAQAIDLFADEAD